MTKLYRIYTNYTGCYPSELEETFTTKAEAEAWVEEFEARATCEESCRIEVVEKA